MLEKGACGVMTSFWKLLDMRRQTRIVPTKEIEVSLSTERAMLAATILGSSMAFIDSTAVNVALPTLQRDLNVSIFEVQWVVESYLLFLSALILVGGALGDRFGRRRMFAIGIGLFTGASAWVGLAPNIDHLILARAAQGIGGALLVPGSLALISTTFSGEQRGWAIGMWSAFTSVTTGLGPVLGGWFVEYASWRWVFFINIPLAVVVLGLLHWGKPEIKDQVSMAKVDWGGALLATVGLGAIVYSLIEAGHLGLNHPLVLWTLATGIGTLIAFVLWEVFSRAPMMPLTLFYSRVFTATNALTVLLYAALGGALFFIPFNLIQVQGYSATAAGAALLPLILLISFLSPWASGLQVRFGSKVPLVIGAMITSLGYALLAIPGIGGSYWTTYFPGVAVLGLGMGLIVAPLTTTVMNSVEIGHAGIASAINNAAARIAGLLGIAALGLVVVMTFTKNIDGRLATSGVSQSAYAAMEQQRLKLMVADNVADLRDQERKSLRQAIAGSFVESFRLIMIIAAGLSLASGLTALMMISGLESTLRSPSGEGMRNLMEDAESQQRAA